ncbi:FkbM family methyltransferase [Chitinophagaceae bacterium 26-R-25]|nr:FkbM family methyltransferase [Chitinophagaceae bacterium 26-R-25]
MNFFDKVFLKMKIESNFLLRQKWGLLNPMDSTVLPKYLLKKYIPRNAVIIDCGAHYGSDSVELARIFPKSEVHSFEAVPTLFNKLKNNTRKYKRIRCYNVALSNETIDNAKFYVSSGTSDGSSSLLEPKDHLNDHPDVHFNECIDVKTISLDDWAHQNNIKKIDFLWLDMQGFEMHMLQASKTILPTVKAIYTEVSLKETYKKAPLYDEFRNFLIQKGFTVAIEAIQNTDMGNVLFINNNSN